MFLPLFIVALLGTVSCHVAQNHNAYAEHGNDPAAVARYYENSENKEMINYSSESNITVRAASPSCRDIDYDFAINEIKGTVGLHGQYCSPGDNADWDFTVAWKLKIFGVQLLNDKFYFNPRYSEVHRTLHLGVAKADLKLGVYNYCIKITGEACYWALKWRCADINETPHCFKRQSFLSTFPQSPSGNGGDDCNSRMRQIAELANSAL